MRARGEVERGNVEFRVVGTVRGLVSEADRVGREFRESPPQAVALGVAPEDLRGLEELGQGADYEHDYSEADAIYAHFLEGFGPVELPPRDLLTAVQAARERGIPLVAIDLPEADYVDAFTRYVTAWQLLRYNRLVRKLAKRAPGAPDAMTFHLQWDAHVRRLRGFDALERAREDAMVRRLLGAQWPAGRVLVLVEAARVEGVLQRLEQQKDSIPAFAR